MNHQTEKEIPPFAMASPASSVQEILKETGESAPFPLNFEQYQYLGCEDIDYTRYTSEEFFQQEIEKVWAKTWQWACREEHIPNAGDYTVYDIGPYSIVITRTEQGSVKAYYNSCLHRGTKLFPSGAEGSAAHFTCPYHGWQWHLDGQLKHIPSQWDFQHKTEKDLALPEVHVALWGGFVFINLDDTPQPFEEYISPLDKHFENWKLEDRYIAVHVQKELPCNWKAAAEAFMENYHTQTVHPQLVASASGPNTQYDVLGEHLSRFYNLTTVPDPILGKTFTEQEKLENALMGDSGLKAPLQVPEGGTARNTLANHLRKQYELQDIETEGLSDAEIIDTIEYTLFPNMFLFPGLSLPMIYRFRPLGMSKDTALFDLIFLKPVPRSGERPDPAEPIRISLDELYVSVDELDPGMAAVYDQDTSNMALQQQGFYTSRKTGQTLGNYQEIRIRHLHSTIDKYLQR